MSQWWIDEPMVLGSSNPTTSQVKQLFQEGFRAIVSLLDESEQLPNYDNKEVKAMGFDRFSIPVKDFTAPTLDKYQAFISTVEQALAKGKVVVHCEGGSGRTGTMAAAYWISKGLSVEEAITRVRQSNPRAIETEEQEESLHLIE